MVVFNHFSLALLLSYRGATTFSMTTLSIMTLSIKGLFVTLSINDIQHKKDIEHDKMHLCWVSLCWVLLCWMSMPQQQKKKRKEEAYPWKAGASSGHITNLKQSILETFNIYGYNPGIFFYFIYIYLSLSQWATVAPQQLKLLLGLRWLKTLILQLT